MAWLSKIRNDEVLQQNGVVEEISMCSSCGKEIKKGGMWALGNNQYIAICENCASILLDLYIDTMQDSGKYDGLTDHEIMSKITGECQNRYVRKVRKKGEFNNKCTF